MWNICHSKGHYLITTGNYYKIGLILKKTTLDILHLDEGYLAQDSWFWTICFDDVLETIWKPEAYSYRNNIVQ